MTIARTRGRRAGQLLAAGVVAALIGLSGVGAKGAQAGPRIYISADMEGLAGVVTDEQLGPTGFGYHAGTTNPDGVRAHTMSSARLADVRINGVSMPEAGINAAIAGHFGVPVIMMSGDDAIAAEAQAIVGPIETAVVKQAISFHAARTMTPAAAQALIRDTAARAVRRIGEFQPYRVATPVTAEVRFKSYRPSQVLALLPMFERADAHSVRFAAADMLEVSRVFEFILQFGAVIDP